MKKLKLAMLILLFASLTQPIVSAHGSGQSFEKEIGDYTVEFEYDALGVVSGEVTPYVFRLLDRESKEAVSFDSMFLRVEEKDSKEVKFAGLITNDRIINEIARISIALNAGTYTFSFYFIEGEEELAEVEFEQVVNAGDDSGNNSLLTSLFGFLAGGLIVYLILKIKKKK